MIESVSNAVAWVNVHIDCANSPSGGQQAIEVNGIKKRKKKKKKKRKKSKKRSRKRKKRKEKERKCSWVCDCAH